MDGAFNQKNILIVEDDLAIRETLQLFLQSEGYEVQAVTNGWEAIMYLRIQREPCLVLLDLMMPVMTGYEFLVEYQQDTNLRRFPVIVVSANADPIRAPGANGYLPKPLEIDHLLNEVRRYCG